MKKILSVILLLIPIIVSSQQYILENVVNGLMQPVAFTFLPDNNIILTQKGGLAKIYTLNNVFVANFWNFTDSTNSSSEAGLIGVCIDPNFSINHYVYFYYNHAPNRTRIVRLTENNNLGTNPFIVFNDTAYTAVAHVSGNMRFGRDNKLYVTIGDNTVSSNSQSLSTFKGKILRLNADGTIPTDNPFYDDGNPHTGNDDRIWAIGLRNSFDFTFSPVNDSIYATENCNDGHDEINFIRKGKNYGWPVCDGFCFPYNPLYKNPMTEIPGSGIINYAPTGILHYTGSQMPELVNKLLVVGNQNGPILRGLLKCELGHAPYLDTITSKSVILDIYGRTTLMQGSDGFVYIMDLIGGKIDRLVYNTTGLNNNSQPVGYKLEQNYPNPFNPVTSIKYEIPVIGFVVLKIFNAIGSEVSTLVSESKQHGSYEVTWDASNFPSGVYFYDLTSGEFKERKKMVLIK